jgi:Fic family protein
MPGQYRTSQNWIGATLRDAVYIPPHHDDIAGLMSDFEKFLHAEDIHTPHLVRIAMLHYQFETIHPFLDGNGRMGRLLITLYLVDKGLMVKPALYLSDFFEHNRSHYYDNLHRVRTHNDMAQWLKFFLAGVIETANSSIETFKNILALKQKMQKYVLPLFGSRQKKAIEVLDYLYSQPAISINLLSKALNMNYGTCNRIVSDLVKANVLKDLELGIKDRFFLFEEYLRLFVKE